MSENDKRPAPDGELAEWSSLTSRHIYALVAVVVVAVGGWLALRYADEPAPAPPPVEAPRPSLTTARFTRIDGSVRVKQVGSFEWVSATDAMVLRKNDLVRTSAGSSAEITFFDGTEVDVRPDSLITIEESVEDPTTNRRNVAWRITSGAVNYEKTSAGRTEVSTPTVRLTHGGPGEGSVGVGEGGDTDVKLFGGAPAEVETKTGATVALAANESVRVDSQGQASQKVVLPPAPELQAPPHQAEIAYPNPARARTLLVWKSVPRATAYHVMVDFSPAFNRPLVDQRAISATTMEVKGLEEGQYYWRVAAMAGADAEGSFSPPGRFGIAKAAGPPPAPPLSIDALDVRMNILQIRGRTRADAQVSVNGQPVQVQRDGSFSEFLTLDGGRQEIVIRAEDPDGGVAEQRRSVQSGG